MRSSCQILGPTLVVAKEHASRYRSGERGWVKVKNPNYWWRDARASHHWPERSALARDRNAHVSKSGGI
jgi:hypothetical protein